MFTRRTPDAGSLSDSNPDTGRHRYATGQGAIVVRAVDDVVHYHDRAPGVTWMPTRGESTVPRRQVGVRFKESGVHQEFITSGNGRDESSAAAAACQDRRHHVRCSALVPVGCGQSSARPGCPGKSTPWGALALGPGEQWATEPRLQGGRLASSTGWCSPRAAAAAVTGGVRGRGGKSRQLPQRRRSKSGPDVGARAHSGRPGRR